VKLTKGATTQPATIVKYGLSERNLVLYDMPAPKTAAVVVCVLESGMFRNAAVSTRTVEAAKATVALEYRMR
jgi:hypothetical protein